MEQHNPITMSIYAASRALILQTLIYKAPHTHQLFSSNLAKTLRLFLIPPFPLNLIVCNNKMLLFTFCQKICLLLPKNCLEFIYTTTYLKYNEYSKQINVLNPLMHNVPKWSHTL